MPKHFKQVGVSLADHLARALAKYQEDEPWETLAETKKVRHIRLGALLAGELLKLSTSNSPSQPCSLPSPSSPAPETVSAALSLSRDQAVEVSVAVPLTVGGVTGALSPESVLTIFNECLKQINRPVAASLPGTLPGT